MTRRKLGPGTRAVTPSTAKPIPTQSGDVWILQTTHSYKILAVGRVSKDGQQDFASEKDVRGENNYGAAGARATDLVVHGRRIFLRNIDADEWSEI
jgi:hypothetical protein